MEKLSKIFLYFIYFLTFFSIIIIGKINCETESEWNGFTMEDGFSVKWKPKDKDQIIFEISMKTKGYIGIGISPTGGMGGSDIVIGWVDLLGNVFLRDYYAEGNKSPILDTKQNTELIFGNEKDGRTTIRFQRKWDTCDRDHDIEITEDTVRLIYSWHELDPKSPEELHYHGGTQRGVRSVYLKNKQTTQNQFPDSDYYEGDKSKIKTFDIQIGNASNPFIVPVHESYYHCIIVKFPEVGKKNHIIGYHPIHQPKENKLNLHHIAVMNCNFPKEMEDIFERYLNHPGVECYSSEVPSEWLTYCSNFLTTIAVGTEGDMMPKNLGIPVGDSDQPNYFRIEYHYDNPTMRQIVDNSGIRLFYTDELKKYDVGTVFFGSKVTPFHLIPPHQKNFVTSAICSKNCTNQAIPKEGIKVISVILHGHIKTRKIKFRHIRNGIELPSVAEDKHYDFAYQQFRILKDELTILPGDEFIVECEYDTFENETFIEGGFPTRREMCQSLILYYPKIDLIDCRSQIEFYDFFNAIGIKNVSLELLNKISLPYEVEKFTENDWKYSPLEPSLLLEALDPKYKIVENTVWEDVFIYEAENISSSELGISVKDYILTKLNWKDPNFVKNIEQKWRKAKQYTYCAGKGGLRLAKEITAEVPKFQNYKKTDENIKNCEKNGSILFSSNQIIIAIFAIFTIIFYKGH